MPPDSRVDDALARLVDAIVPPPSDEDEGTADDRHEDALELARTVLDRHNASAAVSDINSASDLIKRKLRRENPTPDKAIRFSNLYSRLLTQPVLSQKWAILYLLYQLSDSENPGDRSPLLESQQLEDILLQDPLAQRTASQGVKIGLEGAELNGSIRKEDGTALPTKERVQRRPQNQKPEQELHGEEDGINGQEEAEKDGYMVKPPESALLRDLPFNLQGLSSTNIEFTSESTVRLPPTLPTPIISLLHTLAEPCLLYRRLSNFIQESGGGLVGQSLRAAIGNELRSYLGLVATLEGEIRRSLAATEGDGSRKGEVKAAVTLKKCVVWTREATMGLRLMSMMVEESKDKRGGQLISMIHGFSSSHGDPFVGAYAERLLSHVTRPFYDMLRQWIYDGELSDPYHEFFVIEPDSRPDADPRRAATSVWQDKYNLDDNLIPSIITTDFAKKIFLIGKSLNFIRYGCGDSDWVSAHSKSTSTELQYGDTAMLETSIDEAYKTTMARLFHLMDTKFKLFDHLRALKKYLLLGQGDFIALLMESLASNLDRPANSQYRHTLTAQLEHAIRASNAQYDPPDVLRRLDARMLDYSHGETGWECFTLEYKIDNPLDVVITPNGGKQYLKVFNFLWRVKRVEFALGSTWRRCMTGARGVLVSVEDKVGRDWKRARCVVAEMIHFVCQLEYYILFEVIEASWDALQVAISKPGCTLDDLIDAHTTYLQSITHKGLLGAAKLSLTGHREDSFLTQLHEILKTMLAYKDVVDGLYSFSVAEFTRRQEFSAKIETRTAQGRWGVTERDLLPTMDDSRSSTPTVFGGAKGLKATVSDGVDSPFGPPPLPNGDDQHLLASLRTRLRDLSADFKARINALLYDLAHQPDVDMRFLGVVMNFNDVYTPVNRRRKEKEKLRRMMEGKTPGTAMQGLGSGSDVGAGATEKGKEREKEG